ncbi:uncharacterized protein [Salminus brasiliensis]|uniref:uncharacterized protein n=1 Tax=Salminus brasiliensis TaxID=930266 RepID=UPI003B8397C2
MYQDVTCVDLASQISQNSLRTTLLFQLLNYCTGRNGFQQESFAQFPRLQHRLNCLLFTAGEEAVRLQELEGNTVTIHTGLTGVQNDTQILWLYGSEKADVNIVICQVFRGETKTEYNRDRFRDRLQLDRGSGSLTIRNISREDSGVYTLQIIRGSFSVWSFRIKVYAPVSKTVISKAEKRSRTSNESCSPVCSVENGEDVTLSWYEEKERISSISRSDSSEHLHLPLNRTFLNIYTYTCESANPVSHQTTQLNIAELCDFNSDQSSVHCCGTVEVVVRLVLSAVVVLAIVTVLLYHFTSRTASDGGLARKSLLFTAGEEAVRLHELEGNTLTIHTGLTGVQSDAQILWFYRSEKADIKIVNSQVFRGRINTDYNRDRFRDRLHLDRSSGSLTIRNISREDSGVYTLQIIKGKTSDWSFRVKVYAPVSKPVIKNQPGSRSRKHSVSCSPVCSVENREDVTLSWYEEKERISSISRSDSSEHLHLPLNRTFPSYTYTCCSSVHCCGTVEVVVRLVLSAVMALATFAVLLYHFTSRTVSQTG